MELAEAVYEATREFPLEERYCLTNQMRRADISISSNIAEGQGRANYREFRQFPCVARASTCEVQTQLEISRRLGYGDLQDINHAEELPIEVRKMLFGLLKSIAATSKS